MESKKASFFNAFFSQHNSGLRRFIAAKFGAASDVDDLVQEAFQKFLGVDDMEELENPKAYIYQIAHNLALNRIRKQGRQQSYEADLMAAVEDGEGVSPHSPELIVARHQELEQVLAELQQLPEKVRQAFLLSRAENMSYSEISEQMGVSVSSVEKYLMTALQHLREKIPFRNE